MDIDIERLKTDTAYWDECGAPEDATHYESGEQDPECWAKIVGDRIMHWSPVEEWHVWNPKGMDGKFIPRPAAPEWYGKGLPPAGCDCEYDPSVNSWTPAKCIAIGHDRHEPHAVIQTTNRLHLVDDVARLRPLRTKEQRERDELVRAATKVIESDSVLTERDAAEALYDAGMLRKPEAD